MLGNTVGAYASYMGITMRRFRWTLALLFIPLAPANSSQGGDKQEGVENHIKRATDLYAKGQHDKAIKELNSAIRLDSKSALAFSCRGAIWFAKQEYDRAISDLNEAIRLEPSQSTSGYYIRGAAWCMKKDYGKGVKDLDYAIQLNSKDAEALNSRAWVAATCPLAKHRDRVKALDYAKRACEIDGWKNPYYLGTIAAAYAENGDFDNAQKWQRKALEDPVFLTTHEKEGRNMLKLFEHKKPYREEADTKK